MTPVLAQGPPPLRIPPRVRELTAYDKFRGPVPRVLIFQSRFGMDAGCLNAARELGWDAEYVPVGYEGLMPDSSVEQFLRLLLTFKPDFVLTINLSGMDLAGAVPTLLRELRIPCATWFVDNPRTIYLGRRVFAHEYAAAFTWERAYVPYLQEKGYALVEYLPLALDPRLFSGAPLEDPDLPPAFVGSSMVVRVGWEQPWLDEHPRLRDTLNAALDSGRVTRETFAGGLAALLGPEWEEGLGEDERIHAESYLFYEGTRRMRSEFARRLSPLGVVFHGEPEWALCAERRGPFIDYNTQLPAFYRRTVVNLNQTSLQMPAALTQRVFDCPAAGGFLLTDAQPDLDELFAPDEVVRYHDLEECAQLLRWYQARPHARAPIIRRAQERIRDQHLYRHRLETIASRLRENFAGSS